MTSVPVVAGGVVVGADGRIVLACHQGRSWALPMSDLEPGEAELDCARKEIARESGIDDVELVTELGEYVRSALGPDGRIQSGTSRLVKMFLFVSSHWKVLKPRDADSRDADSPVAIWSPLTIASRLLTHPTDAAFLLNHTDRIRSLAPVVDRTCGAELPRHTAIVLVAGHRSRLAPLATETPGCMSIVGGQPLLLRSLDALAVAGIDSFIIVAGHHADLVIGAVTRHCNHLSVRFALSPESGPTGTAASLRCGLEHLDPCDALVLVEGNVLFDRRLPTRLLAVGQSSTAVERNRAGLAGAFVRRDASGKVTEIRHASWRGADGDGAPHDMDRTVNVHAFCHSDQVQIVLPVLDRLLGRVPTADIGDLLRECIAHGLELSGVDMHGLPWRVVDDEADLVGANKLFGHAARADELASAWQG
jgi:choline kinase/ADP-ribose pyrophosphatase YjhB (NUDIX family)